MLLLQRLVSVSQIARQRDLRHKATPSAVDYWTTSEKDSPVPKPDRTPTQTPLPLTSLDPVLDTTMQTGYCTRNSRRDSFSTSSSSVSDAKTSRSEACRSSTHLVQAHDKQRSREEVTSFVTEIENLSQGLNSTLLDLDRDSDETVGDASGTDPTFSTMLFVWHCCQCKMYNSYDYAFACWNGLFRVCDHWRCQTCVLRGWDGFEGHDASWPPHSIRPR